ncbi:hypothetical protein PG996_007234 [Apiospora saccharicola]|uniref:RelA/SpoT domain-containing protein n=1 Tax=Apiospora saccharicola TaxID=335842 RepID=A0ABR1VB44_9PEZI
MSNADKLDISILNEFRKTYFNHVLVAKHHVDEILRMLNDSQTGLQSREILHIPITSRMKTLESAVLALERRQGVRHHHAELKRRLEGQGERWAEYWTKRGQTHRIDDVGAFGRVEEMYRALHDIGGIRICVYFPRDVERVVAFLVEHGEIEVERVVLRGQGVAAPDIEARQLEQYLAGRDSDDSAHKQKWREDIRGLPNYRATHVIVKLEGSSHGPQGNPIVVELQIATVVMHAWSQIEHDIVYKPSSETPEEERLVVKGVLDTFNNVVKTGEAALTQLDNYRILKARQRSKDQLDLADSAFELGVFLFNACRAKSLSPLIESSSGTYSWSYLDQLFDVLRATNEHHKLKLQKLLESLTNREGTRSPTINCDLPLHLLREVYEVTDKSSHTGQITIAMAAKQWKVHHRTLAMQAICCFNLAGYLGVGDDFTTAINEFLPPMDKRPSMVDILDFVHPHRPKLNTRMHDEIVQFCNAFLDWTILERGVFRDNPSKLALIQLPILLTEIGYRILETQPRVDQTEHPTIVRFSLCRLLADGDTTQWVPPLLSEVRDSIRTVHHGLGAHENPEDQQDADHREASPLFMQFRYDERSGVYKKDEMQSGNSGKRFPSPNPDPIDPRSCYFKPSKFDPSSNSPTWVYVKSQGQKRNWRLGKVDLKVREKCPDIESRWRDNLGRFQELSEIAGRMEPGCELTYKTTHNHIGEDTQPTVEFCLRFNDDKYCLMACQDRLWVRDPGHGKAVDTPAILPKL